MPVSKGNKDSNNVEFKLLNVDGDHVATLFIDREFTLQEVLAVIPEKWKLAQDVKRKTKSKQF